MQSTRNLFRNKSLSRKRIKWRFGYIPFLIVIAMQGIPIGRELHVSKYLFSSERYQTVLEDISATGMQKTLIAAIIWGGIYLLASIFIINYAQSSFLRALHRLWPITILALLVPISMFWTDNIQIVLVNSIHVIGLLLIAFAASMFYWNKPNLLVRHLALILGINVAIHVASVFLIPEYTISYEGRWTGLTTNANTLGILAALTIWANSAAILNSSDWNRSMSVIFIGCSVFALYGSNSMTATICGLIAVISMIFVERIRFIAQHPFLFLVFIIPVVYIIGIVFIDSIFREFPQIVGRTTSLTGRIYIWNEALNLIQERPFFGWGFDNNLTVIHELKLPTFHFHNGYLDLAVRGGLVSLVLMLITLFFIISYMSRQEKNMQVIIFSFIALFVVYNITEVSLLSSRNVIWLIFLVLLFCASPRKKQVYMSFQSLHKQ